MRKYSQLVLEGAQKGKQLFGRLYANRKDSCAQGAVLLALKAFNVEDVLRFER